MRMRDENIVEKTMNEDQRQEYNRKDNARGREKKLWLNAQRRETRIQQKRQCTREREKDFVKFYKARNSFCLYGFDCLWLRGRQTRIVRKTMHKGERQVYRRKDNVRG